MIFKVCLRLLRFKTITLKNIKCLFRLIMVMEVHIRSNKENLKYNLKR